MSVVVVFDMDDTLYPERAFIASAFRAVGEHAAQRWGLSEFGDRCIELFDRGFRGDIFQRAFLDVRKEELSTASAAEMLHIYRGHRPDDLPWHADALAAVEALHGELPLALLSDGYLATQRNKAIALGIDRWISDPVFTDALGREHWKPSTRGFELIMSRFPGHRCLYVGDNPVKDFVAPRALGWFTVHVRRPGSTYWEASAPPSHSADMVVADLRSLPKLAREHWR